MPKAAGFFLPLREDRADSFEGSTLEYGAFAEAVAEFAHSPMAPLVCLVSTRKGIITHIAAGRRGWRAGTDQRRLNLSGIHTLRRIISVEAVLERIPARVRRHAASKLSRSGPIPPLTFGHVVTALREISPELKGMLERYSASRDRVIRNLSTRARQSLWAQKEAITSALHFADMDRAPLGGWTPPTTDTPASFIDGLDEACVREDLMVFSDQKRGLPDLEFVKDSIAGVARFENREVALEVIIANRTALEEQTGADLIYFNATYNSFVLVQYKAMDRLGSESEVGFRLPNSQLAKEIRSMDQIRQGFSGCAGPSHRHGFRLAENPFFLKLCSRSVFDAHDNSLVPGMYLPLEYWSHISKDRDLVGVRGGRTVTYRNIGRYLNNSDFACLVRGAWVGTTPSQTAKLSQVVKKLIRHGKAAIVAIKIDKAP